jgi:hypothetical protein
MLAPGVEEISKVRVRRENDSLTPGSCPKPILLNEKRVALGDLDPTDRAAIADRACPLRTVGIFFSA